MEKRLAFSSLCHFLGAQEKVPEQELEALFDSLHYFKLSRKECAIRLGERETRIYFVAQGILRAWFECDGEDRTAAFVYRGFWGSSFHSFLSGAPSEYELEAMNEVHLLGLYKPDMERVLATCPSFATYYHRLMEFLIVGMQYRERELLSSDARSRFRRFMNQSAFLLQEVPQKYLASYLNMSAETFSRLRREWMDNS